MAKPRTDVNVKELKGKALNQFFTKPENKGKYPGYSTLSAAGKRTYIKTGEKPVEKPKPGSANDLKDQIRKRIKAGETSLKGFSKLRKDELQVALDTGVCPEYVPNKGTVDYLRALAKKHQLPNRSKAKKKADLELLLAQHKVNPEESL